MYLPLADDTGVTVHQQWKLHWVVGGKLEDGVFVFNHVDTEYVSDSGIYSLVECGYTSFELCGQFRGCWK